MRAVLVGDRDLLENMPEASRHFLRTKSISPMMLTLFRASLLPACQWAESGRVFAPAPRLAAVDKSYAAG